MRCRLVRMPIAHRSCEQNGWVGSLPIDPMEVGSGLTYKALVEYFAEACRMSPGQTDVFVEMKCLNLGPIEARRIRQGVEELELRSRCGGNDSCVAMAGDGLPNCACGLLGGSLAERWFVTKYPE